MIAKILIALVVIVVLFVVVAALQPSALNVVRSTTISAPPAVVFAQVNDLHQWQAWSPWEKLDPTLKRNFEGAPAGNGAVYAWAGNSKVGEGRMTIVESRPNELLRIKLEFLKPIAATNEAEFTFKPEGNQTAVTWSMSGQKNFMSKAAGLLMNMEKMIGGQFAEGLANLKATAETAAKK